VHVDAYRIGSALELDDLDIDFPASIVVVEWARDMLEGVADQWLQIDIVRPAGGDPDDEDAPRVVTLTANGDRWKEWVDAAGD